MFAQGCTTSVVLASSATQSINTLTSRSGLFPKQGPSEYQGLGNTVMLAMIDGTFVLKLYVQALHRRGRRCAISQKRLELTAAGKCS